MDPGGGSDVGLGRWTQVGEDRTAYQGFVRIVHRTLRLPDGRTTVWDMLDAAPTVAVLPLIAAGEVVLVRQFRAGPMARVLSLPGGLVDEGEDVLAAAVRELREETGYAAGRLEAAPTVHPNYRTRPSHTVVAHDCVLEHPQDLDEFEDCEVVLVALEELRPLLREGRLSAAEQTYLALDHLGLL